MTVFWALVILGLCIFIIMGIHAAYLNGVRDGYSNTFLPIVQEEVKRLRLVQGEEVEWE